MKVSNSFKRLFINTSNTGTYNTEITLAERWQNFNFILIVYSHEFRRESLQHYILYTKSIVVNDSSTWGEYINSNLLSGWGLTYGNLYFRSNGNVYLHGQEGTSIFEIIGIY